MTTNESIAKQLNAELKKKYNVEVSCNHHQNFVLFGNIENVQRAVRDLCVAGLSAIKNEIPNKNNPYYSGKMTAIVGKL